MRVGIHTAGGTRDFNFFQQLDRTFTGSLAGHFQVQAQHFFDLETHRVAWVQRGHGVLEDHRHVFADDLAALTGAEGQHVLAVEGQGVGGDDAGVLDQAHQRHHGDRFARARFADNGQDFAFIHRQAEAVDDRHGRSVAKTDVEILDF